MNMQAMLKQAQKLQKDMMEEKEKVDAMEFEATSTFVTVKGNGKKEITEVKISKDEMDSDDIEMLQDMIVVAMRDLMKQIDDETNKRMNKYTQGMPGLF